LVALPIIYPLYTALLLDSRVIRNPTNHSDATVSVSLSLLSAHFFNHISDSMNIQLAEVGWASVNKGFKRKRNLGGL